MQLPIATGEIREESASAENVSPNNHLVRFTYLHDPGVFKLNSPTAAEVKRAFANLNLNVTTVDYVMFLRGLA